MFERYTERARRVLFFARYEAIQLGSTSIATEHLLLGLIREGKGMTSRLFADAKVSLESIRREIERRVTARPPLSTAAEIPFSIDARRALQHAAAEAGALQQSHIGTEHLLLGLLREERSMAAELLEGAGLRLSVTRDAIAGHNRNHGLEHRVEDAEPAGQDAEVTLRPERRGHRSMRAATSSDEGHTSLPEAVRLAEGDPRTYAVLRTQRGQQGPNHVVEIIAGKLAAYRAVLRHDGQLTADERDAGWEHYFAPADPPRDTAARE